MPFEAHRQAVSDRARHHHWGLQTNPEPAGAVDELGSAEGLVGRGVYAAKATASL